MRNWDRIERMDGCVSCEANKKLLLWFNRMMCLCIYIHTYMCSCATGMLKSAKVEFCFSSNVFIHCMYRKQTNGRWKKCQSPRIVYKKRLVFCNSKLCVTYRRNDARKLQCCMCLFAIATWTMHFTLPNAFESLVCALVFGTFVCSLRYFVSSKISRKNFVLTH